MINYRIIGLRVASSRVKFSGILPCTLKFLGIQAAIFEKCQLPLFRLFWQFSKSKAFSLFIATSKHLMFEISFTLRRKENSPPFHFPSLGP